MVNTKLILTRARELGLRQVDLAEGLGIAQPTLNQKIHNIRPMTLEECGALARMLRISGNEMVEYFFVGYLIAVQQEFLQDESLSLDLLEAAARNNDAAC